VPDDQRYERQRAQGHDARGFSQGVHDGTLAQGTMEDWVAVLKFLFRFVTLPVWLPYRVWMIVRHPASLMRKNSRLQFLNEPEGVREHQFVACPLV